MNKKKKALIIIVSIVSIVLLITIEISLSQPIKKTEIIGGFTTKSTYIVYENGNIPFLDSIDIILVDFTFENGVFSWMGDKKVTIYDDSPISFVPRFEGTPYEKMGIVSELNNMMGKRYNDDAHEKEIPRYYNITYEIRGLYPFRNMYLLDFHKEVKPCLISSLSGETEFVWKELI